jgi:hypothetical protein
MQGAVLIGVAALRIRMARCFLRLSCLVEPVGMLVGAPLLLGTLRTGVCISMEHVILLLSSIWGVGTLGGVCTLGTCCMLGVAEGVAVSSKRSGHACTRACVASIIC